MCDDISISSACADGPKRVLSCWRTPSVDLTSACRFLLAWAWCPRQQLISSARCDGMLLGCNQRLLFELICTNDLQTAGFALGMRVFWMLRAS